MKVLLPNELRRELVAVGADPVGTSRLSRPFSRVLARRLCLRLAEHDPGKGDDLTSLDLSRLGWLHPRAIWVSLSGTRVSLPAEVSTDGLRLDLEAGCQDRPRAEHRSASSVEYWLTTGIEELRRDIDKVIHEAAPALSESVDPMAIGTLDAAVTTLRRCWSQAACEFEILIRAFAHVEGDGFRSATLTRAFGTIFAGADYLVSVPAAVEMLLRETAHHSLVLRNAYAPFLRNGLQPTGRGLGPGSPSVGGVLRTAHALGRVVVGMSLWSGLPDAPVEVQQRRGEAVAGLALALKTLREHADWTPLGREYFTNLLACYDVAKRGERGSADTSTVGGEP